MSSVIAKLTLKMIPLVSVPGCGTLLYLIKEQLYYRHTVVSATLVKAGSHRVLPLDVEEVRNSDGQNKQDCEVNAAKRLSPRLRQEHPQLPWIIGGDDLYCHEPCIAQLRDLQLHYVLVCQPT